MIKIKAAFFICCFISAGVMAQPVFTYGSHSVSKEEFIRSYKKNLPQPQQKQYAIKAYLDEYARYKLKVKAAKELRLDTLSKLQFDLLNFKLQLEDQFMVTAGEAKIRTRYRVNKAISKEKLFMFADSVTLVPEDRNYAIAKEVLFTLTNRTVLVSEWLNFVKDFKTNYLLYKGETYDELLENFTNEFVLLHYRNHLEEYDAEFKNQLQDFREGNLLMELMQQQVWDKSTADAAALRDFYEKNKDQFLWNESALVVLVNAKSYAYADYAHERMENGADIKKIAANSEGMIQAEMGRYEITQLPLKPGCKLSEGYLTEIVRNPEDSSASFVKVLQVYPVKQQRSFEEARQQVINLYQKKLEETILREMAAKYPLKINQPVLQTLFK